MTVYFPIIFFYISPDKTSSKFEITLTLDLPWKAEYADKNSQEYANFTRKVEEQVTSDRSGVFCYL